MIESPAIRIMRAVALPNSAMRPSLRVEYRRAVGALKRLDRQTMFVLLAAAVLVICQMKWGSRRFFDATLASYVPAEWRGLLSWGWWFFMQGFLGFVLPVASLLLLFRRSPSEIGLGVGDARLAIRLTLLYLPFVLVGTWGLSNGAAFQAQYPHYQPAARDWGVFFLYEGLFLFYWFGWEYLWRGFVLFGTARTFGHYAIFVQAMPFAILHFSKPVPEALLSVVGGVALGALVWRCRSFWIAVPLHAAQMLILDFWCTLRIRSGVTGIDPGALLDVLRKGFFGPG